jgi:hypothetical protein
MNNLIELKFMERISNNIHLKKKIKKENQLLILSKNPKFIIVFITI